jgi:hypothetical protein
MKSELFWALAEKETARLNQTKTDSAICLIDLRFGMIMILLDYGLFSLLEQSINNINMYG